MLADFRGGSSAVPSQGHFRQMGVNWKYLVTIAMTHNAAGPIKVSQTSCRNRRFKRIAAAT